MVTLALGIAIYLQKRTVQTVQNIFSRAARHTVQRPKEEFFEVHFAAQEEA